MSTRLSAALLLATAPLQAGGLRISDVAPRLEAGRIAAVQLTVAWRDAWRDARNHDGAWIVLRAGGAPVRLASGRVLDGGPPEAHVAVPPDRVGAFVHLVEPYRGDVEWRIELAVHDAVARAPVTAFALEMVRVPGGPFELGDDHAGALAHAAFFRVGADGQPAGPYRVTGAAIPVGREAGALFYDVGDVGKYRGDQRGPIPASFPQGTAPFWIMKHELTQGDHARFLNALPAAYRARRAPLDIGELEDADTCSIEARDGRFVATAPQRPCNFVTWDDTCAFLDWVGLRPMTELEFEKACRGPRRPVPGDYPWGTADRDALRREVQRTRDLSPVERTDGAAPDDARRAATGASYYGVLDLSGSLWERVVSAGHPRGRAFRGTLGDGVLAGETGDATNDDWPRAGDDGRSADGIGYRGGAEYFSEPSITNPYSPVAVRTYAAYRGAHRYKTYQARGVR